MKRIKTLLLILALALFLPISVNAEENKVTIKAPSMASKGNEISVDIVLSSDVEVDGFKGIFTYESSALELLNYEIKDNWKLSGTFSKESPVSLDLTHENGIALNSTVITIKFKIKDDATQTSTSLSIEGTSKVKEDETINTLEKSTTTIEIKSRDNSLKSLKLNGVDINNFSPNTYSYKELVESTVTTANFDAELNDKTATYKDGYAPKTSASLDYGDNVFEIIVVSASDEEKKYTVTVVRQDNRGTENRLSELIVNSNKKLFTFKEDTLNYTITTHKLETIDIVAKAKYPKATVKIDKPEKLVIGTNTIKITVLSEKNEEKVYTITVNNSDKEIDTTLKKLELFGVDEDIDFKSDVKDYEILYKSKYKDKLVIKAEVNNPDEAEVDKAGYEADIEKLGPGKKITIKVYAKDGTEGVESYYTITFKQDNRINFFLILGIFIFIVLLIIFIYLFIKNKKQKKEIIIKEEELQKTKRLEKIIKE